MHFIKLTPIFWSYLIGPTLKILVYLVLTYSSLFGDGYNILYLFFDFYKIPIYAYIAVIIIFLGWGGLFVKKKLLAKTNKLKIAFFYSFIINGISWLFLSIGILLVSGVDIILPQIISIILFLLFTIIETFTTGWLVVYLSDKTNKSSSSFLK